MTTLDRYVFERVLGGGTAGTVWRARGPDGEVVAVKRVRVGAAPGVAARLRREAAVLAELDHPNIITPREVVDTAADVALVLPLAEGGSLADLLATRAPLPPAETLAIVLPLADALASAHRCGVLHRDVAPGNVLLTAAGVPLLSDFGAAVAATAAEPGGPGTPGCVDPAVLDGAPATPASDVHALAAVAFALLRGRFPYDGPTDDDRLAAARAGRRELLSGTTPGVPPAVTAVLDAALDPDPARRPSDGAALATALRAAVRDHPPAALGPAPRSAPRRTATAGTVEFGPRPPSARRSLAPPRPGAPPWPAAIASLALAVLGLECATVPAPQLATLLAWQAPPACAGLVAAGRRARRDGQSASARSPAAASAVSEPARSRDSSSTRSRSARPNGLVR